MMGHSKVMFPPVFVVMGEWGENDRLCQNTTNLLCWIKGLVSSSSKHQPLIVGISIDDKLLSNRALEHLPFRGIIGL